MTKVNNKKNGIWLCDDPKIPYQYSEAKALNALVRNGFAKALARKGYRIVKFELDMPKLIQARDKQELYFLKNVGAKTVELIEQWIEDWETVHVGSFPEHEYEIDTTQILYYLNSAEKHQKMLEFCLDKIKELLRG